MTAPSYGESTWGSYRVGDKPSSDDDDYNEHEKGDKEFLPKYVMYNTQAGWTSSQKDYKYVDLS